MADIPFGEVTDRTETRESSERMYLEATFTDVPQASEPPEWTGESLTLLHVEEQGVGFAYELHGRDEHDEFLAWEISEDTAQRIVERQFDGVWTYAELPNLVDASQSTAD